MLLISITILFFSLISHFVFFFFFFKKIKDSRLFFKIKSRLDTLTERSLCDSSDLSNLNAKVYSLKNALTSLSTPSEISKFFPVPPSLTRHHDAKCEYCGNPLVFLGQSGDDIVYKCSECGNRNYVFSNISKYSSNIITN